MISHPSHQPRHGHLEAAGQCLDGIKARRDLAIFNLRNRLPAEATFDGQIHLAPALALPELADAIAKTNTDIAMLGQTDSMGQPCIAAWELLFPWSIPENVSSILGSVKPKLSCGVPAETYYTLRTFPISCSCPFRPPTKYPRFCVLQNKEPAMKLTDEIKAKHVPKTLIKCGHRRYRGTEPPNESCVARSDRSRADCLRGQRQRSEKRSHHQPGTRPLFWRLATLSTALPCKIVVESQSLRPIIQGLISFERGEAQ